MCGQGRGAYIILVGKPAGERNRDHWQDMRTWEDNIKMGLQRGGGTDWIGLVHDREKCREA